MTNVNSMLSIKCVGVSVIMDKKSGEVCEK